MLVQVVPRPIVPTGGSGVGMPRCVLDIAKTGSSVEAQGHEGVPEVVVVERVGLVWHRFLGQPP